MVCLINFKMGPSLSDYRDAVLFGSFRGYRARGMSLMQYRGGIACECAINQWSRAFLLSAADMP